MAAVVALEPLALVGFDPFSPAFVVGALAAGWFVFNDGTQGAVPGTLGVAGPVGCVGPGIPGIGDGAAAAGAGVPSTFVVWFVTGVSSPAALVVIGVGGPMVFVGGVMVGLDGGCVVVAGGVAIVGGAALGVDVWAAAGVAGGVAG